MADPPEATPQRAPPFASFEGDAYDCGRQYAEFVLRHYPDYRRYLDMAGEWRNLPTVARQLIEHRAPYLLDLYRGLLEVAGPPDSPPAIPEKHGCTSFGIAGSLTADRRPLSGQTKDTPLDRIPLYLVLRLRIHGGPTILTLCYPGEILGYGLWSTGMSLFRNDLNSIPSTTGKLTFVQFGLLALAGTSVEGAIALAEEYSISDAGNLLLTDASGESASIEFNAGGAAIIRGQNGINIHTNHPMGNATAAFEQYPDAIDRDHSRYRAARFRKLLESQHGGMTPASLFAALADHGEPRRRRGICRHLPESTTGIVTTAAAIAENAAGRLHVVLGNPCQNRPNIYEF